MAQSTVRDEVLETGYNRARGAVVIKEGRLRRARVPAGDDMDLHCPNCGSTDLKRISLAYEEGLYRVDTGTRLRGLLLGTDEPSVFMGRARTRGSQQTELSRRLRRPVKWSYLKLIFWAVCISFVLLLFYIHVVMGSSSKASAFPVMIYAVVCPSVVAALALFFWRHNRSTYRQEHERWNRSFLCQHCGAIGEQEVRP